MQKLNTMGAIAIIPAVFNNEDSARIWAAQNPRFQIAARLVMTKRYVGEFYCMVYEFATVAQSKDARIQLLDSASVARNLYVGSFREQAKVMQTQNAPSTLPSVEKDDTDVI